MYQVHGHRIIRPAPVPLTMQAVSEQGAYLMDSGRVFVMWLGRNVSPDFMTQVCMLCQFAYIRGLGLPVELPHACKLSEHISLLLSTMTYVD